MMKMAKASKSEQLKGSGSTYFFDVQEAKTGSKYLRITQSRKAEEEGKFERTSIVVFPEDVKEFGQKVAKLLKELK
jgi:hypothetical protein